MRKAAAAASPVKRIGVAEMRVAERAPFPVNAASSDLAIRLDRIVSRRGEDHCHEPERHDERADGDGDGQPPRLREPTLELHPRVPPAMSRPISSIDADPAGSSPTISPS